MNTPWIIAELFSCAAGFVCANVACFPARKPGGQYEFRFVDVKWARRASAS